VRWQLRDGDYRPVLMNAGVLLLLGGVATIGLAVRRRPPA
jgi:hypothetical protein